MRMNVTELYVCHPEYTWRLLLNNADINLPETCSKKIAVTSETYRLEPKHAVYQKGYEAPADSFIDTRWVCIPTAVNGQQLRLRVIGTMKFRNSFWYTLYDEAYKGNSVSGTTDI